MNGCGGTASCRESGTLVCDDSQQLQSECRFRAEIASYGKVLFAFEIRAYGTPRNHARSRFRILPRRSSLSPVLACHASGGVSPQGRSYSHSSVPLDMAVAIARSCLLQYGKCLSQTCFCQANLQGASTPPPHQDITTKPTKLPQLTWWSHSQATSSPASSQLPARSLKTAPSPQSR